MIKNLTDILSIGTIRSKFQLSKNIKLNKIFSNETLSKISATNI